MFWNTDQKPVHGIKILPINWGDHSALSKYLCNFSCLLILFKIFSLFSWTFFVCPLFWDEIDFLTVNINPRGEIPLVMYLLMAVKIRTREAGKEEDGKDKYIWKQPSEEQIKNALWVNTKQTNKRGSPLKNVTSNLLSSFIEFASPDLGNCL